jgi:putative GTP pyrophosphokinase
MIALVLGAQMDNAAQSLERFYVQNYSVLSEAVDAVIRILKSSLDETKEELAIHDISGRVKTLDSAVKKYNDKYRAKHQSGELSGAPSDFITDVIGVRIVCLYEDDIPKIADQVKRAFEVVGETDKIATMNAHVDRFGYKALHYDLHLGAPRGSLGEYRKFSKYSVELQIRTIFQDAWSVIDHQLKYKRSIHSSLSRRINVFAALCELADQEFVRIRDDIRATPSDVTSIGDSSRTGAQPLNLREFLEFVRSSFPANVVLPEQADILLAKIQQLSASVTKQELADAFELWGSRIQEGHEYFQAQHRRKLSPLTLTRLLLRVAKPDVFRSLLASSDMLELVERVGTLPAPLQPE